MNLKLQGILLLIGSAISVCTAATILVRQENTGAVSSQNLSSAVAAPVNGASAFINALPRRDAPIRTIVVDFNSKADFVESDGVKGTAIPSKMTAAQRRAVLKVMRDEYDRALGKGVVTIVSGKSGGKGVINMIVTGAQAPGANKGKEYGDAGKTTPAPGIVHEGEFVAGGFKGVGLTNAIGETCAHAAGHKLGLDHNGNAKNKMAAGGLVNKKQREKDNRDFSADDIKKLKKNLDLKDAEKKDSIAASELGVSVGHYLIGPKSKPDDLMLDTTAIYVQGPADEFGYISADGEFVFAGDSTNNSSNPEPISFVYSASENMAVMESGGQVIKISDPGGLIVLSNVNPNNSTVYLQGTLTFSDGFTLQLNVSNASNTTGGFYSVQGTQYHFNVTPVCLSSSCSSGNRYFESSDDSNLDHVGPPTNKGAALWNSSTFGETWVNPNSVFGGGYFLSFSGGVIGNLGHVPGKLKNVPRRSSKPTGTLCANVTGYYYYSGSFDSTSSSANGLGNEEDLAVSQSQIYQPFFVPSGEHLTVTGLCVNSLDTAGAGIDNPTPYEIRSNAVVGSGGTLVCSGTATSTDDPTGRSGFGINEYTHAVAVNNCILSPPPRRKSPQ